MERPLNERAAACTTSGQRPVNEDAVLLARLAGGAELIAVADGMGGHRAGEVASSRALQVLQDGLNAGDDFAAAVRRANLAVLEEAQTRVECRGMGTTLVAALRQGDSYTVVNVGDSRAYRIDEAGMTQLTRDNSFIEEAVRSGHLSAEEACQSPWRNAVTRCIGTDHELEVDSYGPYDPREPHSLLLCTDGVYRFVAPETIRRLVLEAAGPEAAAGAVAEAAYAAGSDDNISAAVVRFGTSVQAGSGGSRAPLMMAPPADERRRRSGRWRGRLTLIPIVVVLLGTILTAAYVARNWLAP